MLSVSQEVGWFSMKERQCKTTKQILLKKCSHLLKFWAVGVVPTHTIHEKKPGFLENLYSIYELFVVGFHDLGYHRMVKAEKMRLQSRISVQVPKSSSFAK